MSALCVGLDARCLNTPHLRGMGKYVSELMVHAGRLANVEWHLFSDRPDTVFHCPPNIVSHVELFEILGHRFCTWEQMGLPWRAWRAGAQVLHCAGTTLPYWQPVPTIVTVHDTLLWKDVVLRPYEQWYWHCVIPVALEKSAAVITISDSSRQDILSLWPRLERKLHVIPHGISDIYFSTQSQPKMSPPVQAMGMGSYLLYVGGALGRKRFSWAIKILERLMSTHLRLFACGFSEAEREETSRVLEPSLRDRVVFLPFVQEAEMVWLYRQSVAVVYPTLYEGFGLPALEAQAVGTPVLFSRVGSLRELEGPAAEILPPDDLEAWVETCRRLFCERREARVPNQAARKWARKFSWDVSSARHMEIYARVAQRTAEFSA